MASTSLPASAYTSEQVSQYLSYIGLPQGYQPTLRFLNTLFTHHVSRVPYENLRLHYSPSHSITIEPQALFDKIVGSARGRGGYCMEVSIFFNHILRALGFSVYTAGAKVRPRVDGVPSGEYMGYVHIVNIVTLDKANEQTGVRSSEKFMVDVGFGGDAAIAPIPLVDGTVMPNIGAQEMRLVRDWLPTQRWRDESQKRWVYQYRNRSDREWNSFYSFAEFEFDEADFSIINWFTGTSPDCFQTFTVMVVKFLARDGANGDKEIYGKIMLVNGEVKRNLGGRTEVIKVCATEEERVDALREHFDIELTKEEIESIKTSITQLGRVEQV